MYKFICFLVVLSIIGCADLPEEKKQLIKEIESLKLEQKALESQVSMVRSDIELRRWQFKEIGEQILIATDKARFVLELEMSQSHFNFDFDELMADEMNKISFTIPVSKEMYDSSDVGRKLTDSFRIGSFMMKGNLGSWSIVVKNKSIELKDGQ